MAAKKWTKVSQKTIFNNDHWSYNLDNFVIENGVEGEYHYVNTNGSTMIIPITSENKIILVKQFRYLNQKDSLEFPCGLNNLKLPPEENALKELREETGFAANILEYIGEFCPYTGASDEMCKLYIASDLFYNPLPKDATEEGMETLYFTFNQLQILIVNNEIWDGLTLASFSIAYNHIKKKTKND
ncbi:ADP-ribose pyrophosphatase [bacterium BMS3Abin04]|nr:ADP-ribose pyrophosphatase [bacterium BMS3Abin04]